jgi:hypothetical protein
MSTVVDPLMERIRERRVIFATAREESSGHKPT